MKVSIVYILLALTLISPPKAFSAFEKPSFDFNLTGFSLKEVAMLSRGTSTTIEAHLGYGVDDGFKIHFWPVASFSSGQLTTRDSLNPLTNTIYLKEASAEKKLPFSSSFKLGALYQKEFLPGIAGQSKAFPAVGFIFAYDHFELRAQAAVPSSSGLATSQADLEGSSSLLSATGMLKTNWGQDASAEITYSHFVFNKLSSATAGEAYLRGNSVMRVSAGIYNFLYNYSGDEVTFGSRVSLFSTLDLKLKAGFLKNSQAPEGLNAGSFIIVSPEWFGGDKNKISPRLSYFNVQSDAMVSVFSDPAIGRTNRQGLRYALSFVDQKSEWQIFYSHSTLLVNTPQQSDDEMYGLSLSLSGMTF